MRVLAQRGAAVADGRRGAGETRGGPRLADQPGGGVIGLHHDPHCLHLGV